jgi:penicillin-binding protein 2
MMKARGVILLAGILLLLVACGGETPLPPAPEDAYVEVTLTPLPTSTPLPTATSIPGGAEGIGLAFFRAWEGKDYLGMYSVLSPQSQALIDSRTFVTFYEDMMQAATVLSINVQPLSARQEGEFAEFGARVTWDTAAVGQITRDHTMNLQFSDGRWGVVWDESLILPELEGEQRLYTEHRNPARANIYDMDGDALAFQGTIITLGVIPGQIEDEEGLLNAMSQVLDMTPDDIEFLYAASLPDWYVPIGDITGQTMEENFNLLQPYIGHGLVTEDRLARLYTESGLAPHIVGYTGFIPAESVDWYKNQGYQGDEKVGLAGVEKWGEEYLRGTRGGVLNIVGLGGEYISTVQEREPKQSRAIYTTIDDQFQAAVEQALAEAIETHPLAEVGSIVVLDVNTGAVRAMASYPDYNPSIFDPLRLNAGNELARVLNDPGRPLLNRVTQGEYPPGSIFKLVTFTAGINSGLYTPETRYTSTGSWSRLGEGFIKYDWLEGGHGTIPLRQALVVSCNSCFYDVGFNLDQADPTILPDTARGFGLGQPTDIVGLPENSGLIPDPEWKLENVGEGWVPGDSVNMAIGQGYVQVTPIQMARLIAAVANGGTLYRPTVIDRIGAGGGAPEEPIPAEVQGQLPIAPSDLDVMQQSLRAVANSPSGTAAYQFVGLPVPVAGKTGTAETVVDESHAWFVGYAPAEPYTAPDGTTIEAPEIAVVVMIEHAGEGSEVAAPIFRRVIEAYYGITPQRAYPWENN